MTQAFIGSTIECKKHKIYRELAKIRVYTDSFSQVGEGLIWRNLPLPVPYCPECTPDFLKPQKKDLCTIAEDVMEKFMFGKRKIRVLDARISAIPHT